MKRIINILLILWMIVVFNYRDGSSRAFYNVKELMIGYPYSTVVTNTAVVKINMKEVRSWEVKR